MHGVRDAPRKRLIVAARDEIRDLLRERTTALRVGKVGQRSLQLVWRPEGTCQPLLPAARQTERRQHRLEDSLVAQSHGQRSSRQCTGQHGMCVSDRTCVSFSGIRLAKVFDPALEEFVAALTPLPENLSDIGVAVRGGRPRADVVETDRNGELRAQAKGFARLTFRQEYAATQVLASHVEKRVRWLDDRNVDKFRAALCEQREDRLRRCWIAERHGRELRSAAWASRMPRTVATSSVSGKVTCPGRASL